MARKRHKKKKKSSSALQSLMQSMEMEEDFKNHEIVVNPQGGDKISAAIIELIKPHQDMGDTLSAYEKLIATSCMAWNTANLPPSDENRHIQDFIKRLPDMTVSVRFDMTAFIKELIERKKLLFPNDPRVIVRYKVTETNDEYNLAVVAMVPKEVEDG